MKKQTLKLWALALVGLASFQIGCNKYEINSSIQETVDDYYNMTIFPQSNITLGASDSTLANRAHALAAMASYRGTVLAAAAKDIDVIYDQGKFWNMDPVTNDPRSFNGSKFAETSLTAEDYNTRMTHKDSVIALKINPTLDNIALDTAKVYYIKTSQGYDGLILVKSFGGSQKRSVTFDYKICKK
jgi:hypothetical protein